MPMEDNTARDNPNENDEITRADRKRPRKGAIIAAAACAAAGLFFTVWGIIDGNEPLAGFGLIFFIPFCAIVLYFVNTALASRTPPRSVLPYAAVVLDLSCIPLAYITYLLAYGGMGLLIIALPLILCMLIAPIAGITAGIATVCAGKKKHGAAGLAFGIIAIILPVIIVATLILLMSMRVIVISLM